jgi:organic hydroperoxide reductase OsmC/OhrA
VKTHTYRSTLAWRGTTAAGYERYDRTHRVTLPPAAGELTLSSDPAFRGDAGLANPEQLLLAAASSCQLLSFLAVAARARVDVLEYDDEAEAAMPEEEQPMRITRIVLRPRIVVGAGTDSDRVGRLVELAHRECFVANSLNSEMVIEPVVEERRTG